MRVGISAAIMLALSSAAAFAQQAPLTVGGRTSALPMLQRGTEIPLKTTRELTTEGKTLKVGDRFDMEVAESIKLNGQTVIPIGTRAVGEVVAVRNKGMFGKSGNIDIRALYVVVGDRQIRLEGSQADKGKAGGVGAVAGSLVFLPVGFFVTGTSARIPAGSQVIGRLAEDLPVAFASGGK